MQLQEAKARFEKQGIKLAAISYDSPEILKDFAQRHKIEYPLLADPASHIVRSFHVFNAEATGKEKGMAYPGFFYIDSSGVIREKYFEAKYTNRFTANSVIAKLFPELSEEVTGNIEAPHLRVKLEQSDRSVVPGSRVSLAVEIELPPEVHVYAPGVKGYKSIQLTLHGPAGMEFAPVSYPEPRILYLEAIQEQVPVFKGKFRVGQDVTVPFSRTRDGLRAKLGSEKTISIGGELKYQACDTRICYTPVSLNVAWQLRVLPLDLKRSPEAVQHK